ncbi:MAG: dihydroorotase [Bacteroidetes bacterium]|nr:dihydroorotase [Bacteroidota bacterium]
MNILIQQAIIIEPLSPYHGSRQDLLIENGVITQIGQLGSVQADHVFTSTNLHVSIGWVDIFSHFCDPGFEYKETIETGIEAAAKGGYTEVMILPHTSPAITGKSQVEYILKKAENKKVKIHPLGALSKNTEGKDLAEMYDMQKAGAVAFTDGLKPLQSAGLMLKALQYVKAFNGIVIQVPDDGTIGYKGLMNEGINSTRLGLPGKPIIAEEIAASRDLSLLSYTESRLHLTGITSSSTLEQIKNARANGKDITCSVTPAHLFFSDDALISYDSNLKIFPPLRNAAQQTQLKDAVSNGLIDCIASHHLPHEYDSKVCEFDHAEPGMIALETAYAATQTALGKALSPEKWVQLVAENPRKIFHLSQPVIDLNQTANLTLFDPSITYIFTEKEIGSKSKNSPFIGKTLTGKVIGTIYNQNMHQNEYNK